MKYTTPEEGNTVGFIGCGAIARNMCRAAATVRTGWNGVVYGLDGAEEFAADMSAELGVQFSVAVSSEDLCKASNVIFTQTPGSDTVLELDWLQKGTTIIASGSDQSTKQEIPSDVLQASKYVPDLTKQTSKVGELRGAIRDGLMSESDVYCELGELVNGKPGREGDELIVVDLTGTGAQDAAIGQVAWDKLNIL
jgi:ornithine cyclodeaminase/alanine dehydrogenase-like protein (mu-crystallin family)